MTAAAWAAGWDCHVHVFDAAAPALAGHYSPATRSLQQIEALAAAQGVGRLVLVQPSVYGQDHQVLLRALRSKPGRHRGVAVLEPAVADAELDALHQAGVRGLRMNRVSPVGQRGDPAPALRALAPRLRERGWHVQWYLRSDELALLPPLQAETGLCFVLDHLAGIEAGTPLTAAAWQHLATLAAGGAWVKLSGWYRLGAALPYAGLHEHIRRVTGLFGPRLVWGSDWPHTGLDDAPPYAAMWTPVAEALQAARAAQLRDDSPARLYA
jgi:predicted TIM-barrel fold metal-dependent hydrolase